MEDERDYEYVCGAIGAGVGEGGGGRVPRVIPRKLAKLLIFLGLCA